MLKQYPAKVLLLGEYTILNGSKALAIPFAHFKGQWSFSSEGGDASRIEIKKFLGHETGSYIDVKKLENDIENGLWFDSTIPDGYGLGSSGALIAAIYDRYSTSKGSLKDDMLALGRLEDFFHGSSSGLDPLVSYIQRPLLINDFNNIEVIKDDLHLSGFFLVNTGKPRQTGPLVSIYKEKLKDDQFKQSCVDILSREVNLAIEAIFTGDRQSMFHHLWIISKIQWDFFPEMIPTKERTLWSKGLESGDYVLKLCGAGGGGYLLGYTNKLTCAGLRETFKNHEVIELGEFGVCNPS